MVETKIIKRLPVRMEDLERSSEAAFQQHARADIQKIEDRIKQLPSDAEIREKTRAHDGFLPMEKKLWYRADIACAMPDLTKFDVKVYYEHTNYFVNGIKKSYQPELFNETHQ